jgi:transposase
MINPSTVRATIRRIEAAGLSWPLGNDVTDTELEARLFASAGAGAGTQRGHRRQAEPDWAAVHRELKHVTLSIVWEEYIAGEPGGYRYSRFCEPYRGWEGRLSVTMRQSHAAGDKLFVDYVGDGVLVVIDRRTGERRAAQIFVAVLGAFSFTYAQATWTQGLADWISGHVGAFEAIGGVPALLVPDNTKVAVIKACLYDPQINRSYADMAAHYGTAILPARPRGHATRRRSSRPLWSSAGCSGGCAIPPSTASPTSTRQSPRCSLGSTRSGRSGGSA